MKKILLIAALVLGSQAFAQSVDQKLSDKTSCLDQGFTFARFYGDVFITDIISMDEKSEEQSRLGQCDRPGLAKGPTDIFDRCLAVVRTERGVAFEPWQGSRNQLQRL